jgi:cell division protein FtsI/penicillin-binding protein 2
VLNESIFKTALKAVTNRLVLFFVAVAVAFWLLSTRLFDLQIINGESYLYTLMRTETREVTLDAARGTVYDRNGIPLAVNKTAYTVKLDSSDAAFRAADINETIYSAIQLFEQNGESYVDDFPISKETPYAFLFEGSETREARWKEYMSVPPLATAQEAFAYLRGFFKLPDSLPDSEARKILNLRSTVYMQRYNAVSPITIAYDVSEETVVKLEEAYERLPGFYADIQSLRVYPEGKYFSHILGYIGKIQPESWEDYRVAGYMINELVGTTGLELSLEEDLRGVNGKKVVEVSSSGKLLQTVETIEPTPGKKVYLTLDAELQRKTYEHLENILVEIVKGKLQMGNAEGGITQKQLFRSYVLTNWLFARKVLESEPESECYPLKEYILTALPEAGYDTMDDLRLAQTALADGIDLGQVTPAQILMAMYEQGVITDDPEYIDQVRRGRVTAVNVVLDKLDSGQLTPQVLNLDPGTASAVVVDVRNGGVLASVGYPSFDNNEFVNNSNAVYIETVLNDPTAPMFNRPFREARAPGSTFKMISAITGLENNVITPRTTIYDEIYFTKAGQPYARCWSSSSHGSLNVLGALEVSCNYFFSEMAYRMYTSQNNDEFTSIAKLNEYMTAFGLNDRTGVELSEYRDSIPLDRLAVSSPDYKEYYVKSLNPNADKQDYSWVAGDTVRTAFGQASNNYTTASMCKYIATLATGGTRYQMHMVKTKEDSDGVSAEFQPVVETVVEIAPENLEAVYEGMLRVTESSRGTARSVFAGFPIRVAGKTGTAQQEAGRSDHSSFGGFAPFENPQIAVYVLIPYGDTTAFRNAAAQAAIAIMSDYFGLESEPELAPEYNALSM